MLLLLNSFLSEAWFPYDRYDCCDRCDCWEKKKFSDSRDHSDHMETTWSLWSLRSLNFVFSAVTAIVAIICKPSLRMIISVLTVSPSCPSLRIILCFYSGWGGSVEPKIVSLIGEEGVIKHDFFLFLIVWQWKQRILSYTNYETANCVIIQLTLGTWSDEPGWPGLSGRLALPRWLLSRYYMKRACPEPPFLYRDWK